MNYLINPGRILQGEASLPGDKSISHRSIILGALATGTTNVFNFLESADAESTINAMRMLGVDIEGPENGNVKVLGAGMDGLRSPDSSFNMGNSGTSMRLLTGLLAAQSFDSSLYGDHSLMSRPMTRIIDPLKSMGACVKGNENGYPPLLISGNRRLKGINYDLPVASAQVKSCLLIAGMFAEGVTSLKEPAITRDHTERMLEGFGYPVSRTNGRISLSGGGNLHGRKFEVPSDLSSAAFFIVGASITPGSDILLRDVGINPTRAGIIKILELMGADLQILNQTEVSGEPVADIRIRYSKLKGIQIPVDLVPLAIDEFPAIFIAAASAHGDTRLCGASELRVKESDRISSMASGLDTLGVKNKVLDDGIIISGGEIGGGQIRSFSDHRIAMAFAIAGLVANDTVEILGCENVATSFPSFVEISRSLGMEINVES